MGAHPKDKSRNLIDLTYAGTALLVHSSDGSKGDPAVDIHSNG